MMIKDSIELDWGEDKEGGVKGRGGLKGKEEEKNYNK